MIVETRVLWGIAPIPAFVEATRARNWFEIVGLPDRVAGEVRTVVQSAIHAAGYDVSGMGWRVVVTSEAPVSGVALSLPVALAILGEAGLVPPEAFHGIVWGELSLAGELREARGAVAIARGTGGLRTIMDRRGAALAARYVPDADLGGAESLREAVEYLTGAAPRERPWSVRDAHPMELDLADVRGLADARAALERAAVTGEGLLLIGPPGCGKSMLASRLPSILPPLTANEAAEVAAIWSVAGLLTSEAAPDFARYRPLRAPHHTASDAGLVGGGTPFRPGEVALAHHGVLFLDELPEFRRRSIEALRAAVRMGYVERAGARFPARVQLIATANPCPCGYHGAESPRYRCACTPEQIARYRARVDQAAGDLFPIRVEVPAVSLRHFESEPAGESSATVRARVVAARKAR